MTDPAVRCYIWREITETTALQLTSVLENGIVYFSAIGASRKETGGRYLKADYILLHLGLTCFLHFGDLALGK